MKNIKNLSRRLLAVLVALLLCVGTLPVAAFAEEADSAAARAGENTDGGSDGPRDVSDNPPNPSQAEVTTSTGSRTDEEGNTTTTTTTDKEWSYRDEEQSSTGTYNEATPGGDAEEVDKITGGESLDEIPDGTYTKTEISTKTDVNVRVEGQEHGTSSNTYDEDGDRIGTSQAVDGTQDTTVTVTETTKVVTTEVTKETSDPTYEWDEGEEVEESRKPVDGEDPKLVGESDGERSPRTEVDGTADNRNQNLPGQEANGGSVTVNLTKGEPSKTVTDTSGTPNLPDIADIIAHCAGWSIKNNLGEVLGTMNAEGKVVDEEGNVLYEAKFEPSADGKTFTFTLKAEKEAENGFVMGQEGDPSDPTGQNVVEGTFRTEEETDEEAFAIPEGGEGGYELTEGGIPVEGSPDSTLDVYTKMDEVTQTDTNYWTAEFSTESLWSQTYDVYERTITVTMGTPRTVTASMDVSEGGYATEQEKNGYVTIGSIQQTTGNSFDASGDDLVFNSEQFAGGGELAGGLRINYGGGSESGNTLYYRLDGTSGKVYTYCLEKDVDIPSENPSLATQIGKGSYELINLGEASYISPDSVPHLDYIAENGFWGPSDLNKVKQLVDEQYRDKIDAAVAMSVTQAALWRYADPEQRVWGDSEGRLFTYYNDKDGKNMRPVPAEVQNAAEALYNVLVNGAITPAEKTTVITESVIEGVSITVKEKVNSIAELDALVLANNEGKLETGGTEAKGSNDKTDTYRVDASMTLALTPSQLNAHELILCVYVGETCVATRRLDDGAKSGDNEIREKVENGKTIYYVNDLEVMEGVSIRFTIQGDQNLAKGLYLLQDENWQNMGVLAQEGSRRRVNLDISLNFEVTEGTEGIEDSLDVRQEIETWMHTNQYEQEWTSETLVTGTKTTNVTVTTTITTAETPVTSTAMDSVYWSSRDSATFGPDDDGEEDPGPTPGDPGDSGTPGTPVTTVTEEPAPLSDIAEEPTPLAELAEDLEIPDEAVPLADMPEELEIPDEEVPLADVPATGDISSIWSILLAASAAGLLLLTKKKSEEAEG